jgi:hypothetical protein
MLQALALLGFVTLEAAGIFWVGCLADRTRSTAAGLTVCVIGGALLTAILILIGYLAVTP